MYDWTATSPDPNDGKAVRRWCEYYDGISRIVLLRKVGKKRDEFIADLCDVGGRVLDIGMAEHTFRYVDSGNWFHRKLRALEPRNEVWGADINSALVEQIRERFQWDRLVCADATGEPFRRDYFDAIHAGDIIEHVSDAGGFMRFCKGALKQGGRLIVTTPNPHAWSIIRSIFRCGHVIANFEHTCWFTPSTINELCRREGFVLAQSWYLWSKKRALVAHLPKTHFKLRDVLFSEYLFVLTKA